MTAEKTGEGQGNEFPWTPSSFCQTAVSTRRRDALFGQAAPEAIAALAVGISLPVAAAAHALVDKPAHRLARRLPVLRARQERIQAA